MVLFGGGCAHGKKSPQIEGTFGGAGVSGAEPLTSGILLSKCHAGADSGASAAVTVPGPFSGGAVSWALSGRSPAFEHSPGFGADSGAWYAASVP